MVLRPLDPPYFDRPSPNAATPPADSGPLCIVPLCRELTYEELEEPTRLSRRRNSRDTHEDFVQLNDTLIFCWPSLVCGMVSEEGYTTYADTFAHLARVVQIDRSAMDEVDGRLGFVSLSDCDDQYSVIPESFIAWLDYSQEFVPPEAALYLVRRRERRRETTFEHLEPTDWQSCTLEIAAPFAARISSASLRLIISHPSGPLSRPLLREVREMFQHYELGFDESSPHPVPFIDEALPFAKLYVSLDEVGTAVREVVRDQLTGCLLRHSCWMLPHPVYIPPLPVGLVESGDEDEEGSEEGEEEGERSSVSSEGDTAPGPGPAVEELTGRLERL